MNDIYTITNFSPETEARTIGALIAIGSRKSLKTQKAMLRLVPECFYKSELAEIFQAIQKRYNLRQSFDLLTMMDSARELSNEASLYFDKLFKDQYSSTNMLESDVETLMSLLKTRQKIYIMQRGINDTKAENIPNEAALKIDAALSQATLVSYPGLSEGETYDDIAERLFAEESEQHSIIKTGIQCFDEGMDEKGIRQKSMIFIAGDSGVGKTNFAIYLMHHLSEQQPDKQVLFFSLEMENQVIMERHLGIIAGKLYRQQSSAERLTSYAKAKTVKRTIFDSSQNDISYIETISEIKANEKPISVIVIDYVNLVECKGKFDRHDLKQTEITNRLAKLAMELNCVVIVLSQVNRNASNRPKDDRCPIPADGSDSKGGHRSCSLWIGIDRPELHSDDPAYKNQFHAKIRKNRYGGTHSMVFAFNGGTFKEVGKGYFSEPMAIPDEKRTFPRELPFQSVSDVTFLNTI